MRRQLLLLAISSAVGCRQGSESPPSSRPSATRTPVTVAIPSSAPVTVRTLDAAAEKELTAAFYANPLNARRAYARVRFRFQFLPHEFIGGKTVSDGVDTTLNMRDESETAKLTAGRTSTVEATITDYKSNQLNSRTYTDVTVVTR